jgi:ribosomal protein S6
VNKYEGLFIFPETLKDTALEEVLGGVKDEIQKHGGEVESATRLGKRAFSRRMKKQEAGHYVMFALKLPGDQIPSLLSRFKLNENVFRVQIVRASESTKAKATAGAAKEG